MPFSAKGLLNNKLAPPTSGVLHPCLGNPEIALVFLILQQNHILTLLHFRNKEFTFINWNLNIQNIVLLKTGFLFFKSFGEDLDKNVWINCRMMLKKETTIRRLTWKVEKKWLSGMEKDVILCNFWGVILYIAGNIIFKGTYWLLQIRSIVINGLHSNGTTDTVSWL